MPCPAFSPASSTASCPGHFVWKDDQAVAFMTIQPIRPGHLLVVPRAEVDHWDTLPEATSAHLMLVSQRIARALKEVYSPLRVGLMIAGLEVPHTHLHVLPLDMIKGGAPKEPPP